MWYYQAGQQRSIWAERLVRRSEWVAVVVARRDRAEVGRFLCVDAGRDHPYSRVRKIPGKRIFQWFQQGGGGHGFRLKDSP